jgi:hypothetical protein
MIDDGLLQLAAAPRTADLAVKRNASLVFDDTTG